MRRALVAGAVLVVAAVAAALLAREIRWIDAYWLWSARDSFVDYPIPIKATQLLMDIGVADVNGDDILDVFTTNHNYRQDLLLGDGKGAYRDVLSEWGLDQSLEFPGLEIALNLPEASSPGLYIYWKGRRTLALRTFRIGEVRPVQGRLRTYTSINSHTGDGVVVEPPVVAPPVGSQMSETTMGFSATKDGEVDLEIETPGVPIDVELDPSFPLTAVYVGKRKVSPRTASFELTFQDRHGMAWTDYNGDGLMDIYITRGALSGTLLTLPEQMASEMKDELVVSEGPGRYRNLIRSVGIEKRGCSGRKVNWVDFNRDGLLDLFINCQDRGNVKAVYPKQLYVQGADHKFTDVAAALGLDLPEHEIIDFVWFDADNDGYIDLLTSEDTGFYLYRNQAGKSFTREFIGRGKFARADNPKLRGNAEEYWFVDGKLSVADFRGSGNLDVFSASKTGNVLLLNDGRGHFSMADPTTVGLPSQSATAGWVDYDNDGLVDLYAVPQGLFRQRADHSFEATGLLALPAHKYMAAIVNWADFANDGRRDVLLALNENFSLWRWWEKLGKDSEDRFAWKIFAYRNALAKGNHWLELRLVGKQGNPQAIGARVTVQTPAGRQTQQVGLNDGAFFSQGHYRLYFGLGKHSRVDAMTIRWPDGQTQELKNVDADRLQVITETEAGAAGGRQ
jgi:hypothetical protein